jgi:hypothetical protein
VDGADFEHVLAQKINGASTFLLKSVKNFKVFNSTNVPDTKIANADDKLL